MTMLPKLFLVLLAGLSLLAQAPLRWTYTAGYTVTGTAAKLTLQTPSTGLTRTVRPQTASVVCAAACTITLSRNGTVATATAGTALKNRTAAPNAQTQVFTASDSSGGTSYPSYPMPAGGSVVLDLNDMELLANERLTIAVAGSSQDITVLAKWEEY
jgi:hypothetical protein